MSPFNEVKDCVYILFCHKHLDIGNSSLSLDLVGCCHILHVFFNKRALNNLG